MDGMGSMMWAGWLAGALIAALLVAGLVAAVRSLLPAGPSGPTGRTGKALLIVLALVGALVIFGALAMGFMHWSMMGGMM